MKNLLYVIRILVDFSCGHAVANMVWLLYKLVLQLADWPLLSRITLLIFWSMVGLWLFSVAFLVCDEVIRTLFCRNNNSSSNEEVK